MEPTEEIITEASETKGQKGFAGLLGRFDTMNEANMTRVLFNLPYVLFIVLLSGLHIANNHLAEGYARKITKEEKNVKQLRWQYMTTSAALMKQSKQSEVAKLVEPMGLKALRKPPYKITVSSKE